MHFLRDPALQFSIGKENPLCLQHHSECRHSAENNVGNSYSMSRTCLHGVKDVGGADVWFMQLVCPTVGTQEAMQEQSWGTNPTAPQCVRDGGKQ